MKKVFYVLVISLCGAVFATTTPINPLNSINSGRTNATLDIVLEAPGDVTTYGFSLTYNSSAADHGLTTMSEKSFDNVRNYTGSVDEYDMRGEMAFYVWWQLFSSNKNYTLKLTLGELTGKKADAPLENVTLPYTMTLTDPATSSSSSNSSGQTVTLYSYTMGGDLTFGIRSVTAITDNIRMAIASKEYSATITLTLESV